MASSMTELAQDVLSEEGTREIVVSVLAEFFDDSFKDDPFGVSDWLAQNGTSVDLFVSMVAELRKTRGA